MGYAEFTDGAGRSWRLENQTWTDLKHYKALHEQVVLLSVVAAEVPAVKVDQRLTLVRSRTASIV